jgi:pyruvate dehydrogenase complex dehydrogenase (E1) component
MEEPMTEGSEMDTWIGSFEEWIRTRGAEGGREMLGRMIDAGRRLGVAVPGVVSTPYVNRGRILGIWAWSGGSGR